MSDESKTGMERNYKIECSDCGAEGYADTEHFAAQLVEFHNTALDCDSADYQPYEPETNQSGDSE